MRSSNTLNIYTCMFILYISLLYIYIPRIRSLERNVSLSTGFLEELSLKYIKQIDELNTAVKVNSFSHSRLQ